MAEREIVDYRLQQLEKAISDINESIGELKKDLHDFKEEERERERKRLLWGISSLGTLLTVTVGVIWSYRGVIFR